MTQDQKARIDAACHKYKYCTVILDALHTKANDQKVRRLLDSKIALNHEIIRITASESYLFWNPVPLEAMCPYPRAKTSHNIK